MQEDPAPDAFSSAAGLARFSPFLIMFASASQLGAFFICASHIQKCGEYHV